MDSGPYFTRDCASGFFLVQTGIPRIVRLPATHLSQECPLLEALKADSYEL
jgi:hypothetical protein